MKNHKALLHIFMVPSAESPEGYDIKLFESEHKWISPEDSINLGTAEVEIDLDIPESDQLASMAIETLVEKQEKVMQDAFIKKSELQHKINALKILTYKGT